MEIAVIGAGYVGLTTAICLAHLGHEVRVFDLIPEKIDSLKEGSLPIFEPGLEQMLQEGIQSGKLQFFSNLPETLKGGKVTFLCVPTPQDEDGAADLSHVLSAAADCSKWLEPNSILATKSTVPVGSALRLEDSVARHDVHVVSNPEFLREGSAINDFLYPDRLVIGTRSREAAETMLQLYSQVQAPKVVTSPESSELIKYASNAFLAIKLSFANDIAALCERTGGDVSQVMHGMGLDSRIGPNFLKAGPGWGGSCFPKDTRALISISARFGLSMPIVDAALESNEKAHKRMVDTVMEQLGGSLEGKKIAVWGIAFKANTDDFRDSPALAVISRLKRRGAIVTAYDPKAKAKNDNFKRAESALEAVEGADALIVLTEWNEFQDVNAEQVRRLMAGNAILDCRSILNSAIWRKSFNNFRAVGMHA